MKTLLPFVFTFFTAFAFGQVSTPAVQKTPIVSRTVAQPIAMNNGSFFKNLKSENVSVSDIQDHLNEWLGLSAEHTFREIANTTDNLGIRNQNFQQFYKGIVINESAVMLHSKDGIATAINGNIIVIEKFEAQPRIAALLAKNNAMQALNASKLIAEYPVELVIMKIMVNEKPEIKLAYKVRIDASDPIQMCTVLIDAVSGKVLRKINLIAHADEPGTGQTVYRGQKAITVDNNQGTYRLRQFGRKIETYDATNATFTNAAGFQNFSDFTNPTSNWSTVNPAIDVHWGMEKTYDFYQETFNRNSYDNLGSPIKNFVNGTLQLSNTQNNAYALPPPYSVMVYGLGDGVAFNPVVGLDVAGHEFSHMVVQNNGNGGLIYYGESGALNESFADIFGAAVEFYAGENANWTIGEGVVVAAPFYLRSMSDPNAAANPSPDTYQGTYWINPAGSFDSGGVHYNSGVQNFWFYLLSEGGTGTNDVGYSYNVAPIGLAKALQIAYRNLTTYLPLGANYGDAREGALQATEDLYGAGSPEYASVLEAWNAVNVVGAPVRLCEGTTVLSNAAGTFTDNSDTLNYQNFSDCKWLIAPEGAEQITLNFTAFQTEFDYDFVTVYDGPSLTAPVLGVFSGSSLPATLSTSMGVGAMLVRFTSDYTFTYQGFSATYSSLVPGTCVELPTFVTATGNFNDGSENDNYGLNQHCKWLIAPPCTETVSLSFSEFETELNEDKVLIYDDAAATNLIATVSGTDIPGTIVSTTGMMSVHFVTNSQNQFQGFSASYTSTAVTPVGYTGNSIQNFCGYATIEDLTQTASTIWFETETGGTPLPTGTTLFDGNIYFATQNFGCETIPRFPVTAHVIEQPAIDSIQPIRKCLRYILPSLSQGKYYTQPGGTGTELLEGDAITTSQTLYVYSAPEPGFDCSAEMEFEVEIYTNCDTPYYGEDFAICEGSNPDPLLDSTPDGVFGEWLPPEINTSETTTYTFSPYDDEFYNPITLTITVTESATPLFDSIPAICSGTDLTALPTLSTNGISGTWSPALNNLETTTYTFTPDSGQCAVAATMTIVVNLDTLPTFDQVAAICEGQTLAALPTTSTNGITGIWSPALNNLQTTTYTFTPDNDQCAVATTMDITVNENVMPTFNAVAAICSGENLSALPTTSLNGIVGTWSPALNNSATTTYTFTPNTNQCAATTTLTITVDPNVTPTFNAVATICSGGTLSALPTTSLNGVVGTWSPSLDNSATTTYTFTPNANQCAATTTLTITVDPNVTPTFNAVAAICSGGNLSALPTTSLNGITGIWSPALNNSATTTYTFTPNANQCAATTTLTITVDPNVTPTFNAVAAICSGATLSALPTTSLNGIVGTWSPSLDNSATTTYTFTPNVGQCATTTTLTITVDPNVTPTFNAVAAICSGGNLSALPTTSLNGIVGTWSPSLNNSATTTYTFTPNVGQCAATTTLTITVDPNVTPTFNAVAAICSGGNLSALPTTSLNGIVGTWSPSLNNAATTTYTFTPNVGQCATTTTLTITVDPNVTPTFNAVAAICSGGNLSALPTTSLNGITGTWSPSLNNAVTTTYTFTPNVGQCSESANLEIVVNAIDATTSLISGTITANQANASYQWMNCNGNVAIAGADAQNFTATQNGDYAVIISFGDCTAISDCVTIDTLGVEDSRKEEFSIYPNPTASILYLQTPKHIEVDRIVIFDVTGKRVIEKRNAISEINVEKLESGVYIIHAYAGNKLFQDRFIKK